MTERDHETRLLAKVLWHLSLLAFLSFLGAWWWANSTTCLIVALICVALDVGIVAVTQPAPENKGTSTRDRKKRTFTTDDGIRVTIWSRHGRQRATDIEAAFPTYDIKRKRRVSGRKCFWFLREQPFKNESRYTAEVADATTRVIAHVRALRRQWEHDCAMCDAVVEVCGERE